MSTCGYVDRNRVKNSCYELNRLRVSAYLGVLDRGEPEVSVRIWEWHRSNEEGGRVAGESLLKEHPRPTAILAASDRLAIGVIEAARTANSGFPKISLWPVLMISQRESSSPLSLPRYTNQWRKRGVWP